MSFFGFGQSADIEIELDGADTRKLVEIKQEDGRKDRYYLYYDGESVSGKVNLSLKKAGSRLEHQGIKVEFVGQIELYYDRGNHHEFTSLVKELARPGELIHNTSYDFEFNQVEKAFESYTGTNVRLRYFLRVTVVRRISDIVREMDLIVHTLSSYPDSNNSIKMEVGIEDCLHIEFEYNKSKYHLKDVIVGKIYFLLVRIKIKHMEIAIMKRETTGSGPNTFNENETIAKYEIMDGAPVRGESIPIRVFLAGYDLTPSMRDINKKFSVRYYLNLVLVDEEERRYFKQQEITLWRKGERVRRPLQEQLLAQQQAMQQLHLGSQHSVAVQQQQQYRQQQQSGEVVPPLGAEPPSPHQSQSPMQEEIPSVPNATVPTNLSNNMTSFQQHTIPSPQQDNNILANNNETVITATSLVSENAVSVTTSASSFNNNSAVIAPPPNVTIAQTNVNSTPPAPAASDTTTTTSQEKVIINKSSSTIAATEVVETQQPHQPPPLVCSTTPPPLPVSTSPVVGSTTPPLLPPSATTPPPIEDSVVEESSSPVKNSNDVAEDHLATTIAAPEQQQQSSLGSCSEPPELPSPPSGSLESPEDEFMEASAASPTPAQQKKQAALAQ